VDETAGTPQTQAQAATPAVGVGVDD